jgi:hypothetical protein
MIVVNSVTLNLARNSFLITKEAKSAFEELKTRFI